MSKKDLEIDLDIDTSKIDELREVFSNGVIEVAEDLKVLKLADEKWLFYYKGRPYLVEYWQKNYYWKLFIPNDT